MRGWLIEDGLFLSPENAEMRRLEKDSNYKVRARGDQLQASSIPDN